MWIYSKNVYFPNQVKKEGYLKIENGKIKDFQTEINEEYEDYGDNLIIPGFIDQHIHGFATGSFTRSRTKEALYEMQKHLPKVGVTSFLATTGAEPIDNILKGIELVDDVMKEKPKGSNLIGVHLEGPFVNVKNKGMMSAEYFLESDLELMKKFVNHRDTKHLIKLMTMAPELPGSKEVIEYCKANNVQINIGHSSATFDDITDLKAYGLGGVTHMFSGMTGLHHRELGVAGTALYYDDLYCEFAKQTGMTVKFEAFDIAYRIKGPDRIIMTTDNTGLAQVSQEHYHYIRQEKFIPDGDHLIIEDKDGNQTRIDRREYENVKDVELGYIYSIQNLIKNVNPSVHEVIKMTSENSAKYLGIYDTKGSLEIGKDADILVVDKDFNLIQTYCLGEKQLD